MSRSTFYYHTDRLCVKDKYTDERKMIFLTYHRHKGRYGYRRVKAELLNKGYLLNHKTVHRLMKEQGLYVLKD